MKNVVYERETFDNEWKYQSNNSFTTVSVGEAVSMHDAVTQEIKNDGGVRLYPYDHSSLAIFKIEGGYSVARWSYVGPGYGEPETFRERVIVFLERLGWGWEYIRCQMVLPFGFIWDAGTKWPRRNK